LGSELFLVTGACGHLGSQIVKQLVLRGERVRVLKLPGENDSLLSGLKVESVLGDVRDVDSLRPFFSAKQEDEVNVIHAAGIVTIAAKVDENLRRVNVEGTRNIVGLCMENKVRRLLYVSSVHALPERPRGETVREASVFDVNAVSGAYAKTKAEATRIVLDAGQSGLNVVVVHPSGIIGPGDLGSNLSNQIFRDYLYGRLPAIVKGGYDFVDVRDVAGGCILALKKGKPGNCYILANTHYEIRQLTDMLQKFAGIKRRPLSLPLWLVSAVAPLAETLDKLRSQRPLFTRYSLYTLSSNDCFSSEKARTELGYTTRPMEETMRDIVLWEREKHGPTGKKILRRAKVAASFKGK
jgi:dihydroflavonol-4-reductase